MANSWLRRFYERPDFARTEPVIGALEIIRWWESRRVFFNLVVGCTGLFTCFLLIVCAITADSFVGEPIGMTDGPLLGILLIIPYALLANVFDTGGWISELLFRASGRAQSAAAFGLKAFRAGITFSIIVTLSPAAFSWFVFAIALFKGQKHGPTGE
jgi:hypothetical protein